VSELDEPALQASLDRLADADLLFVEGAPPRASYRFKHALIQDAAYDSLLKSRRQALHRRAAELLRDDPERAAAEPEAIAHHFTQAGIDDSAIEWWGIAGDQALRRSAFQEAIAHLGKAIAMADKAAGVSSQAQKLHVAYGNALIAARGHGAPETTGTFARAWDSALGEKDAPERLAADYGLWVGSLVRGELSGMRAHSKTFLGDVEARPDSPEAGVAHHTAGTTHWFAGEYVAARQHLEGALALFQPGRDDDLMFRFGQDRGVTGMLYLAFTLWPLGDIRRAVALVGDSEARIAGLAHIGTRAFGRMHAAMFELMRGDIARATRNAAELAMLASEHDLPLWRAFGVFLDGLAVAQSGPARGGLEDMRRGVELLREQNFMWLDGLLKIALAEAEARAGDVDHALAILDEALATCDRIEYRSFEADLHRARGEILLKRDPANPAPAEEALLTAIGVAKQQGTRSFELRAALSLAKLYQSTGRPANAHAVLAPALEGFSPTSEMPEIAEAQALLAVLAETDQVKNAAAVRRRQLQLQTAYGRATMWSRGLASDEAAATFARAESLAEGAGDIDERFAALYGRWITNLVRGELQITREVAETFRREAEALGRAAEVAVGHRFLGLTSWVEGNFTAAKAHLEEALRLCDPERDRDTKFRYAVDTHFGAALYLAPVSLMLGDIRGARKLIDEGVARAAESGHLMELINAYNYKAWNEVVLGDAQAALHTAGIYADICRKHQLEPWLTFTLRSVWARARLGDRKTGIAELRRALAAEKNWKVTVVSFRAYLAELEAEEGDFERALVGIDEALALARETGAHATDAFLHRLRGEIYLKRDSANPSLAEEAFQSALAIAQQQGGRFYGLRAALSLAKLYQATGRPAQAHGVLGPALEGFTPTPEMPEIAEARALMERLA
jgi:predicted ATPase